MSTEHRVLVFPASYAQQRLWLLHQLSPESPAYNMPAALRLTGTLDTAAFLKALAEVQQRHESLRTTFLVEEGEPVQVVHEVLPLPVAQVDLSALAPEAREAEWRRLALEEARRPFDLGQGPLLRATLLRLGERQHGVLLTMHHIISDGWSIGVLARELGALYEAFLRGRPSPLEPLALQYADFAEWQREWLEQGTLEQQRSWWKGRLSGRLPVLELPTDRPRPPVQSLRGAHLRKTLSAELTQQLREVGRRQGGTLFMTLLSAFATLLHRYSGQTDLVVGSAIANRNRVETEPLIGFFVNTLPLRLDLSGDPRFSELLARTRETTLEAYAHQDVPFEKLVQELQPQRELSRTPLFQVMFSLVDTPLEPRLPGLGVELEEVETGTSKFDLALMVQERPEGLRCTLEYCTDLFEAATMERLLEQLEVLLRGLGANAGQRLSELPLLSEAERHQVLRAWNDTAASFPRAFVHEQVAEQARRTPEALAVASAGRALSYAELERRANALAWHLRALGVGPEVRVGICLERSVELLVALLATLKAGGAYVPLDTAYPRERLRYMLEDCGARVVLTTSSLAQLLPEGPARAVCLDTEGEALARQHGDAEAPASDVSEGNLAYVIYTSGSTGRPKGVGVSHGSLGNLVAWYLRAHEVGPADRFSQLAGTAFDACLLEMWPPLVRGASLHLPPEEVRTSPEQLVRWLASERISVSFLPTPLAEATLALPWPRESALRRLLTGGDRLRRRPPDTFPARLLNHYGPTECTVVTSWGDVSVEGPPGQLPDIGRPLPNTQVYVLDGHQRPLPVGVPGELYVGGTCVARGYLGRPELTAERFVPHPFSHEPGARLYRTGDRVRWLPDGRLEFLGRADDQVKVRGFRIEPGEIEATLARHPEVREAVVVAREVARGERQLVAYAVARSAPAPSVESLRAFLSERLPAHMVPSAFLWLEALPLTPNGKVDRQALPALESALSERAFIAPRTPTESVLAGLWCEVLGVERVGAEDGFFELGGHSLLATRVLARIREAFQLELPLRALFESSRLAELATRIDGLLQGGPRAPAPRIAPRPSGEAPPLSFAQQRLWFLDQLLPGTALNNIPAAVRMTGALEVRAFEQALSEVVRRHESLRTTFELRQGQAVQLIHPPQPVALPVEPLEHLPAEAREGEVRRRVRAEAARPFDLTRGPLLRASLLRLGGQEHVLLLTMHHIVSDAWSMEVLLRELAEAYAASREGRPVALAPLPIQYADFAHWQRQWLAGEVLQEQLAWWKERLAGAPSALELPTDRPRPSLLTYRGARHWHRLPAELSAAVKRLAQREGASTFMTLLAAFQALLSRYTGQQDVVVGSPIANRSQRETEGLIGFFVNTVVLRTDLSGDPTFLELLRRVRDVTLGAHAHQDVPFERLVEELQPRRDLSRPPLFQVMFVLREEGLESMALPGLSLHPLEGDGGSARYDLTLFLVPGRDGALVAELEYSTDLFDAGTVERLAGHLEVLLRGACEQPGRRVSELPLLSESERRQVLALGQGTPPGGREELFLHQRFLARAAQVPDAVAVLQGARRLTYGELRRQSTRLAHHLRAQGVGPGTRVGLLLERSPAMVVGLLAVLEAGGAYVPLDPEYPRERLDFMVEDSGAALLVTESRLLERLSRRPARVVCLDAEAAALEAASEQPLPPSASPDEVAYLIYTSGSTGRPKGVMVSHRNLAHSTCARLELYARPVGRYLLLSSFSFDSAVAGLFWTLVQGGALVLPEADPAGALGALEATLQAHRPTHLLCVPSLYTLLLERSVAHLRELEVAIVAGEACPPELVARHAEALPGAELYNEYGPTEASVWSTVHRCVPDGPTPPQRVPIGRPIPGARVHVLDGRGELQPVGVPGELYVGGPGIARGYHARPELTAERFLPDGLGGEPGARLYRTGDRVRWLPEGSLEFLGRVDAQVKLRGYRIELGELESALRLYPAVREAAVAVRGAGSEARLVAWVVPHGAGELPVAPLREHLRTLVPEYMVPALFVPLERLPLSPNGKLDRAALALPTGQRWLASAPVPLQGEAEQRLAALWSQLLGVPAVGAQDNFFDLGGHSLLLVTLQGRLRQEFGLELPLVELFRYPTVRALAGRVSRQQGAEAAPRPSEAATAKSVQVGRQRLLQQRARRKGGAGGED